MTCGRVLLFTVAFVLQSVVFCEKLRLCTVDGRKGFSRSEKNCPVLESRDSLAECVIGVDRMDCLRRISKGTVDFTVFNPEDLITAANSDIDFLLTNELKLIPTEFEYEVVAVISDSSGIKNRYDLKGKRLCHQGFGFETDWTRIISNFFEATVVPQLCDPALTITENRIKATSQFFGSACKAGPWVDNEQLDAHLKSKYPNLCRLCDDPERCSSRDKYAGRRGPLLCLTDGAGDVAWARLDDVRPHFGITPGLTEASTEGYSLLCPDGSIAPVNTSQPCVWVVMPWPAIAARRKVAVEVQQLLTKLPATSSSPAYVHALQSLLEAYPVQLAPLNPPRPAETHLSRATGFLAAHSFSGCHPPRTVRLCVDSVVAHKKCTWLREAAAAYGVEPGLDCVMAGGECLKAVESAAADVVMVTGDAVWEAERSHNLKALFYETVYDSDKYITVPVVKKQSGLNSFDDLKRKSACFPKYSGIAWNSVLNYLNQTGLIGCPNSEEAAGFFGVSCVPDLPENGPLTLLEKCEADYKGDFGALKCLLDGNGDVAFISQNSLNAFIKDPTQNQNNVTIKDFQLICVEDSKHCHLSWAPIGQAMVRSNSSKLWLDDTLNVFLHLDDVFGKHFQSRTIPFSLFGQFNGISDVLFHDATQKFRSVPTAKNTDLMPRSYNEILSNLTHYCPSGSGIIGPSLIVLWLSAFSLGVLVLF